MSGSTQCPNCGGYKITVAKESKEYREVTERYYYHFVTNTLLPGLLLWFLLFILVGAVIVPIFWNTKGMFDYQERDTVSLIISLVLTVIVGIISYRHDKKLDGKDLKGKKLVVVAQSYYCNICGNRWDWQAGMPTPRVTVRRDLLEKVEAQAWNCPHCGTHNDGTRQYCSVCNYPKS